MPNILQDRKVVKYTWMQCVHHVIGHKWDHVIYPPPPLSEESLHTGLDAAVARSLCEEMAKLNKMLIKVPKSFTVN